MFFDRGSYRVRPACIFFGGCLHAIDNAHDRPENLVHLADALHGTQLVLFLVIGNHRMGLGFIYPQAVTDGLLVVVTTVTQPPATLITAAIDMGSRVKHVIHLPAVQAGTTAHQALDQGIHVDRHQQCQVNGAAQAIQQLIERLGLRQIARKAIEDKAIARIRARNALMNDRQHDLVTHQLPGIHGRLGLPPERGSRGNRLAQHVTGGNLRQSVFFLEQFGLGPLTGARCTKQYDPHRVVLSPSRLILLTYCSGVDFFNTDIHFLRGRHAEQRLSYPLRVV